MAPVGLFRERRSLSTLAIAALLIAFSPSSVHVGAQQGPARVSVLITFDGTPGAAERGLVHALGGHVRHAYHLVPGIAASMPAPAVDALRNSPGVLAVEPDVRIEAFDAELDLTWGVNRIGAGTVHGSGITGAGVRVAVLDSGVEYTHYELAHAFSGGWDFVNDDDDPLDDNGHGTHVSGTIAAADDNAWVVGAAPGVQLFGLKILDAAGTGDFSDVIAALQWAVDHGVQIANHSYGSSEDPGTLVAQAFANSAAAGMLHVAAAGNTGNCRGTGNNVSYPARYGDVIAVGAIDQADARTCTSSTGPDLELAAPGDFIPSAYLNGDIAAGSGTSMASPHVAGAAALLMSAGVLDAGEVRSLLTSTAQDLGPAGRDKLFGFGLINVAAAAGAAGPAPPSLFVGLSTDQTRYDEGSTSALLTLTARDETGVPVSGLTGEQFTALLDGAEVAIQFAESATPGTYSASLDITGLVGQHALNVQVAHGTETGNDTAAFVIAAPSVPGTISVSSIEYEMGTGRNRRTLLITLSTEDGNGAPVAGAAVTIVVYLNNAPNWLGQAVTDASGQLTFGLPDAPAGSYFTEVWGVTAGALTWDGVTPPNGFVR